jgi:hypothetical protein
MGSGSTKSGSGKFRDGGNEKGVWDHSELSVDELKDAVHALSDFPVKSAAAASLLRQVRTLT